MIHSFTHSIQYLFNATTCLANFNREWMRDFFFSNQYLHKQTAFIYLFIYCRTHIAFSHSLFTFSCFIFICSFFSFHFICQFTDQSSSFHLSYSIIFSCLIFNYLHKTPTDLAGRAKKNRFSNITESDFLPTICGLW